MLGLVGVFALLCAALTLALLDRRQHSPFLSRMALILFLCAFVGGVLVTLIGGIKPRNNQIPMGPSAGKTGPMGSIGSINEGELKTLQEKVAQNPRDIRSRERLGHIYLQQQDFENVFRMAHEALQINPKSVESLVHMGMVLFAMQDPTAALQQFDKALAIDPKNQEAIRFKGMVTTALSSKK